MTLPRVLCLTTGGTIASSFDESAGGLVAGIGAGTLVAAAPGVADLCELETVELATVSSTWLEPEQLFDWARDLRLELEDHEVAGAIVVTGTETLEEAAYLFDLVLEAEQPVVFTGAARTASEQPSDGPRNLHAAAAVATAVEARGLGVLVVFGDEIHAARDAMKIHPDSITAFASPAAGPLGSVRRSLEREDVVLRRRPATREHVAAERIEPRVALVPAAVGADASLIDAAVAAGARGIVIETFPAGGITPAMAGGVERALGAGVVIAIASRAAGTLLSEVYGGVGEGRWLRDRGVLFADDISAAKTRIKLMLALGLADRRRVPEHFRSKGR